VLGPHPCDRAMAYAQLGRQQPRGPMRHAEVLGWRCPASRPGSPRAGSAAGLGGRTVWVGQPPR
jgi:hypothetical protein